MLLQRRRTSSQNQNSPAEGAELFDREGGRVLGDLNSLVGWAVEV